MSTQKRNTRIMASRRGVLRGAGAFAATAAATQLGFPGILRAAEPIRVGVLQPYSGGLELLGNQGLQGAQLAIDEANAAGGVLDGRMIEVIQADTKTDPKTAVEAVTKLLLRDQVHAVVGPVTSANRDAIQPTIERYKTPLLYATDYEGGVCSRYILCYSALPDHWVNPFVPYLTKNAGKKLYLVGSDYVWPQKMNEAIRKVAAANGGEVVGEEYVPFGVKDFTATLRKIEASGATVLVNTVVGADAVTFMKQFTAAGLKDKATFAWFGFSENYLPALTPEESEGILTVVNFVATLDRPESKAFVAKVKKAYGEDAIVSGTVDAHYMITRFLINGVQRAQSDDKEKIIDAMVDQTLMSANGEVHLRASDRHTDLNVVIAGVENGQLLTKVYVGRVDAANQCG